MSSTGIVLVCAYQGVPPPAAAAGLHAFYDIDAGLVRLSTFSTHSSYNKTFIVLFIIGSQLYGEQPNAKCNKKKTVFEILVKI